MTYLSTPPESPLYEADREELGYVPDYLGPFAHRPEVYAAWQQLGTAIRAGMDLRRYELVTVTTARRIGSEPCAFAHAAVLRDQFYDDAALRAIVLDHHDAQLDPVDVAIMDFADRVAADPTQVTEADVEGLRQHGLSDPDIFQVVLAVSLRRFFSGVLSAVGVVPDAAYDRLDPDIRAALKTPSNKTP